MASVGEMKGASFPLPGWSTIDGETKACVSCVLRTL